MKKRVFDRNRAILDTLAVSQNLTSKRKLENEQRILNYRNAGMAG
jgi:hypothetical protein